MDFFEMETAKDGFTISLEGRPLLHHSAASPALFIGRGDETITMFRGNFNIRDRITQRLALRFERAEGNSFLFSHPDLPGILALNFTQENGLLHLTTETKAPGFNRLFLRLEALPGEHITGGGEQFSALDLRGRKFPIWTREQGVGRNKLTEITRLADSSDGGGGDYHTTFFPQPVFLSITSTPSLTSKRIVSMRSPCGAHRRTSCLAQEKALPH